MIYLFQIHCVTNKTKKKHCAGFVNPVTKSTFIIGYGRNEKERIHGDVDSSCFISFYSITPPLSFLYFIVLCVFITVVNYA